MACHPHCRVLKRCQRTRICMYPVCSSLKKSVWLNWRACHLVKLLLHLTLIDNEIRLHWLSDHRYSSMQTTAVSTTRKLLKETTKEKKVSWNGAGLCLALSLMNESPVLEIICHLTQNFLKAYYCLLLILLLSSDKFCISRQLGLVETWITWLDELAADTQHESPIRSNAFDLQWIEQLSFSFPTPRFILYQKSITGINLALCFSRVCFSYSV